MKKEEPSPPFLDAWLPPGEKKKKTNPGGRNLIEKGEGGGAGVFREHPKKSPLQRRKIF